MTLILGWLSHENLIQVSDRRLTRGTTLCDDDANKAVVLGGHLAFAYTGVAEIEGQRTDKWIARTLRNGSCRSVDEAVMHIKTCATDAFRRMRWHPQFKRHCFVAQGWVVWSHDEAQPTVFQISNAYDDNGQWLDEAQDEFRIYVSILPQAKPQACMITGQPLCKESQTKLGRVLRRCFTKNGARRVHLHTVVEQMTDAIRCTAAKNPYVGSNLLVTSIPKAVLTSPNIMLTSLREDPLSDSSASFLYLPQNRNDGIAYGPITVSYSGTMLSEITVEEHGDKEIVSTRINLPPHVECELEARRVADLSARRTRGSCAVFDVGSVWTMQRKLFGGVSPCRCPDLPPSVATDDGLQLDFINENGVRQGGYTVIDLNLPNGRCRVKVIASIETIAAMKADPRYIWIRDVEDPADWRTGS